MHEPDKHSLMNCATFNVAVFDDETRYGGGASTRTLLGDRVVACERCVRVLGRSAALGLQVPSLMIGSTAVQLFMRSDVAEGMGLTIDECYAAQQLRAAAWWTFRTDRGLPSARKDRSTSRSARPKSG